ncbi:hypothetical protein BC829DRAFT_401673, partial [Chytridium lagenaria]
MKPFTAASILLALLATTHATNTTVGNPTYCTNSKDIICPHLCSRTIIRCTGPESGYVDTIPDPNLVCIPSCDGSDSIGFWYQCQPPVQEQPIQRCTAASEVVCPEECGKTLIRCTGMGKGQMLDVDQGLVCTNNNPPYFLVSEATCKLSPPVIGGGGSNGLPLAKSSSTSTSTLTATAAGADAAKTAEASKSSRGGMSAVPSIFTDVVALMVAHYFASDHNL